MTSEEILASIDRHFALGCEAISTSQLRAHYAHGVCGGCDLRAVAEQNPEWVAAGRPLHEAIDGREPS